MDRRGDGGAAAGAAAAKAAARAPAPLVFLGGASGGCAPGALAEEQETRSERVAKAMRQAGAAASGMARAAARAVWTMLGGRHVEETAEKSGPPRAGDHGEPGEAATGDG